MTRSLKSDIGHVFLRNSIPTHDSGEIKCIANYYFFLFSRLYTKDNPLLTVSVFCT